VEDLLKKPLKQGAVVGAGELEKYRIRSGGKIRPLADMKNSDRLTHSACFGEKMSAW
jgi:hypothetical protein